MQQDAFNGFHPIVNLLYFVTVIGFSMFFLHPVFLILSLLCAASYAVYLGGRKTVRLGLALLLPMVLVTAALNPLFNHQGATILAYLPNGNPVTLESTLYGLAAATMLVTVILWFSCLNAVITQDKFVYLFGRILPALSLILAMSLRLVPRFRAQLRTIATAQKGLGRNVSDGNLQNRARHGLRMLSILVTWVLENSIDTADSMKARGYGLPGRTAFSIFRFERRDAWAILYIAACAAIVLIGAGTGAYHFRYFPTIRGRWSGPATIVVFCAQFALGLLPILLNVKEARTWKRIESNM